MSWATAKLQIDRLLQHRCLSLTGPSVVVDLSSLALVMKDVEDIPTLRAFPEMVGWHTGSKRKDLPA